MTIEVAVNQRSATAKEPIQLQVDGVPLANLSPESASRLAHNLLQAVVLTSPPNG